MSTAAEIEDAIRRLPSSEAQEVARWLQEFLSRQTPPVAPACDATFAKWRGRGKLPAGRTVDEYLKLTRDAYGS